VGLVRKPLVPIDGSASAMRALEHALAQLRGHADAELHLLNVQVRPVHTFPGKLVSPDLIDQELRHEGEALLENAVAPARIGDVAIVRHVRIGHPGGEIAACAAEQCCDAIVMGTRGMGAIAGILLGSVATKVVHLAQVPVTLVK
jgi:nucleotide-binding universal stress UspA family protein